MFNAEFAKSLAREKSRNATNLPFSTDHSAIASLNIISAWRNLSLAYVPAWAFFALAIDSRAEFISAVGGLTVKYFTVAKPTNNNPTTSKPINKREIILFAHIPTKLKSRGC